MPLDPAAQQFLDSARTLPQPDEISLAEFREAADRIFSAQSPAPDTCSQDVVLPGGDGQPLIARLYKPDTEATVPMIVWAHGGSFVRGRLDHFDAHRRAYAKHSGCAVLAIDQRLSPESTYPAPLEDMYAAFTWAVENAVELGADHTQIGVGGESSGGNLAAATALLARRRGGPHVRLQVLIAPLLDAMSSTASAAELGEGYILTRSQIAWCFNQYAPGGRQDDPLISPFHESDHVGLAPAAVVTIEFDPVRDEGDIYARRLAAAGVPVRHRRIDGMVHHYPGPDVNRIAAELTLELLAEGASV
jgi:acetyl esterase